MMDERAVPTSTAVVVNAGNNSDHAAGAPNAPPLFPPHPPPNPTLNAAAAVTSSDAAAASTNNSIGGGGMVAMVPPAAINDCENDDDDDDDDMLLVTEFPPPPYYYSLASRQKNSNTDQGSSGEMLLKPPKIPYRAFRVAAKKAKMEHQKRKLMEEEERRRVLQLSPMDMEGMAGDRSKATVLVASDKKDSNDDDDSIDVENPNEPLVAVFGEIVEDPTLFQGHLEDSGECDDPAIVRENVKRLNCDVLHGFLALVRKLAEDDPCDHRNLRDELSHNLFLMLQECNKFREHQARELLIETLELQLQRRKMGLELLKEQTLRADDALEGLRKFCEK